MTLSRRWAWLVALAPLVAALLATVLLGQAERDPQPTDTQPRGLDSTLGTELAERLPEGEGSTAIIVFEIVDGTAITSQLTDLEQQARKLGAVPAGGKPGASVGGPSYLLSAEDGTAAVAIVPLEGGTSTQVADQVTDLRERADAGLPDGTRALVTGPAAIEADLAEVFSGADLRLLGATAGVVALLLIITYRSPVLWLVPLTVIAVADRFAAVGATHLLDVLGMTWNESTVGILSVLVFGAGTDYALLLISRYRDELRHHGSRYEAMALAMRRTAEAVLSSAVTVVVGVLTLALSLTPTTRGLGVACALGIVIAAAFALVVLPAALVLFGRWVFWPRVPLPEAATAADGPGVGVGAEGTTLWHRVGRAVARRPAVFAIGTGLVIVALAANIFSVRTGLDVEDQFLDRPEAIDGAARIGESFPAGVAAPTNVVTSGPADEVRRAVEQVGAVDSVQVSAEGAGVTELSVVLDAAPGSQEAQDAIDDLRSAVAGFDDTHVTGQEAEAMDEAEGAARDRLLILPLILALVLLALGLLLRSVLAPLVLVATVVATYAASLGASWWIFTGVFDFGALDAGAPLLSFLFLVALGVDYNIFLLTRTSEELPGHGTHAAMLRSLAATGGVITSAGILLAAVFLVLGVLPLVVLAQLGVIVCIGVLLDTLVVRTVLVPALVLLLGDRFWWPRRVPPADVQETSAST